MIIENFNDVIQNKYADFEGRARRSEFWYFILAVTILYILAGIVDAFTWGYPILMGLLILGLFIPSLALVVRRLHDTNKSGWFYLLNIVPFGGLVLLVFYCMEGTPGPNNYGPDPKNEYGESMADHLI